MIGISCLFNILTYCSPSLPTFGNPSIPWNPVKSQNLTKIFFQQKIFPEVYPRRFPRHIGNNRTFPPGKPSFSVHHLKPVFAENKGWRELEIEQKMLLKPKDQECYAVVLTRPPKIMVKTVFLWAIIQWEHLLGHQLVGHSKNNEANVLLNVGNNT